MSRHRVLQGAGFVAERQKVCRWCKGPLPKGRYSFCSGDRTKRRHGIVTPGHGCVHEHCLRSQPAYMRQAVYDRDRGVCAIGGKACGVACEGQWQADHIIPVSEGGGECGLDNMRTLCTRHHKEATKALAARRAEARRKAKGAA